MKKILFAAFAIVVSSASLMAQRNNQIEVIDGAFDRTNFKNKTPVPLSYVREADAVYSWNIIRVIDLTQKQNLPLVHPANQLIEVLLKGMKSGELNGYIYTKEDLTPQNKMTPDVVLKELNKVDTVKVLDPITGRESFKAQKRDFNPNDCIKYRIKEEWFFDKQLSSMQVRIIAIAPVVYLRSEGQIIDEIPMFWVYYPAIRSLLSNTQVFNWKNDAAKLSYDDFFIKRLFGSYIYKESNVRDERIQDYAIGAEALKESDRIKYRLVDFEQALWEY